MDYTKVQYHLDMAEASAALSWECQLAGYEGTLAAMCAQQSAKRALKA